MVINEVYGLIIFIDLFRKIDIVVLNFDNGRIVSSVSINFEYDSIC